MNLIRTFLLFVILSIPAAAASQQVALKTNLIDDALLDINVGIEVGVAPKWSVDMPVSLNYWKLSNNCQWRHWAVQPGARYWFCERFQGHFVGAHAHGGMYNVGGFNGRINILGTDLRKLADARYQGWFAGAGISYGYAWILGKHWNIEGEIGLGFAYTRYDRFKCSGCGQKTASDKSHVYWGPTKAAINIVYIF